MTRREVPTSKPKKRIVPPSWRRLAGPPILGWYVHLIGLVVGQILWLMWRGGKQQPDDWSSLWVAGRVLAAGHADQLYAYDPFDFILPAGDAWLEWVGPEKTSWVPHPFVQSPAIAVVTKIMGDHASYLASVHLLVIASGWALAVLVASAWRMWFHRQIPVLALLAGTTVMALSTPFQNAIFLGQTSPLIVAGTAYAIAAARLRPYSAGIALGLVATVKLSPFALVVVFLVFAAARRSALVAIVTSAAWNAWALVDQGWGLYQAWFDRLHVLSEQHIVAWVSQSIVSLVYWPTVDAQQRAAHDAAVAAGQTPPPAAIAPSYPDPAWWVLLAPKAAAVAGMALFVAAAWRRREFAFPLVATGTVVVSTCFSGMVWTHYFLIAIIPALGVIATTRGFALRGRPLEVGIPVVVGLSVFFFPPLAEVIRGQSSPFFIVGGCLYATVALSVVLGVVAVCFTPQKRANQSSSLTAGLWTQSSPPVPQPTPATPPPGPQNVPPAQYNSR